MRLILSYVVALVLSMAAFIVLAHSMSPIEFGGKKNPSQSITMTGLVFVPITIGTRTAKDYLITVDDEPFDTVFINANSQKMIKIPVKMHKPNRVERHLVCSIGKGSTFNTKICTKVKAYWLKDDS